MEQNQVSTSIYLGIGGNEPGTGEAIRHCLTALDPEYRIEAESKWYASKAWGKTDQNDFTNLVVKGSSSFSPINLMSYLLDLELKLGRNRATSEHWGPRLIDIDVLYWEGTVSNQNEILLPHPQLLNRSFAVIPLLEIAPYLREEKYFRALTNEKLGAFRKELNEIAF